MGGVVKIQGREQVLGALAFDSDGRRVGRVFAVHCAPDPYTAVWFVVQVTGMVPGRVAGRRRRLRAVPAEAAKWAEGGGVWMPYEREQILRSPPLEAGDLTGASLAPNVLHDYYETERAALRGE